MGVRGIGATKSAAFAHAAVALTGVITDPDRIEAREPVTIDCAAPDDELLLVDWLNRVIFEIATRKMLFRRFDVLIDDHRLHATAWGEATDVARHQPAVEVKGATYTALRVSRREDGAWVAQCVVDV